MNISKEILNTQETPSVSEQIISNTKELSLTDQILYNNTETPEQKILSEGDVSQFLSPEDSEDATSMSKHLYGDNAPEIYTQEDLDEANEYEYNRSLEEDEDASIANTLDSIAIGTAQAARLQREAVQSAYTHFLASEFRYDGGLRLSDLKQHQAEAVADNDFSDMPVTALQRYQDKLDRTYKVMGEIVNKTYKRGLGEAAVIKTWNFIKDIVPGSYNAMTADRIGAGFLGWFTPGDNAIKFHDMWQELLTNDQLTPEEYELLLRNALDKFDITGSTYEDQIAYIGAILDMDVGTAVISAAADAAVVGGAVVKTVKAGAKYGLKGAGVTATKMLFPYLTASGAKSVLRAGSSPIKTAKKLPENLKNFLTKQKFVGNVKGAIDTAAKSVGGKRDVAKANLKEALNDPDIKNTIDPKTGKVTKTVLEDVLSESTQPVGSAVPSLPTTLGIVTTRAYNRSLREIKAAIDFISNTSSIDKVQKEIISNPADFERAYKNMLRQVPEDLIDKKKVGDIVKTFKTEEAMLDPDGGLVFRVRLPGEFVMNSKSKGDVNKVIGQLNTKYAQAVEAVPLTDGKYAIELDFHTHKGFGELFMKTADKGEKTTWSGMTKSAAFTVSSTPGPVRRMDYIRSAEVDFLTQFGKDTKAVIKKLSRSEKRDLEFLLDLGTDASKPGRYSSEVLKAKGFSDNVIDAYNHSLILRDINFLLVNEAERTSKVRAGFKIITVNGKELGEGVFLTASTGEALVSKVTASGKKLIIGHIDAAPISVADITAVSHLKEGELAEAINAVLAETDTSGISKEAVRLAKTIIKGNPNDKVRVSKTNVMDNVLKSGELAEVFEKMRKGEYKVFQTVTSTDGATEASDILYVLPKNAVVSSELPAYVMNYVPGWNRYYDRSAAFVKQGRIAPNGEVIGVNTLFASTRLEDLQATVDSVETLRKWCVENEVEYALHATESRNYLQRVKALRESFQKILQDNPVPFAPFTNLEEFVKWAGENRLDIRNIDNVLEIVKNDQVPSIVKVGSLDGITGMKKETIDFYRRSTVTDAINSEWKMRQAHRYGGSVLDYNFKEAQHVDVDKTLQYLVDDMIAEGVMPRYEEIYSNIFGKQFRSTIAKYIGGTSQMSDAEILKYSNLEIAHKTAKSVKDKELLSQAITAQRNYAVLRGIPNSVDTKLATAGYELMHWLGAKADAMHIPTKLQSGVRASFEWLMDTTKPLRTAQAIAAHRFLGCLNISQAFKNFLGPASLIVAAEGKNGAKAFKDVFGMIHRLHGTDKNLVNTLKKLDAALGSDFKESDMIFRNLLLLDTHSAGIKGGLLGAVNNTNKLSRASLFFFNRADLANRVMAFDTALRKFGYDKKAITSALELGRVGSYADSLYINMSRRGLSRIQHAEWSKIFLQFTGYMMKYMETMLFDSNLTVAQRRRMLMTTLLLSGGMGLVGTEIYNALSPKALQPSDDDGAISRFIKESIQNGLIDSTLKGLGVDVSVQGLFGPAILDKVGDFLDTGLLSAMSATPAIQTIRSYFDAASDLCHFLYHKYVKGVDYLEWKGMLELLLAKHNTVSSTDKLYTAYKMFTTGLRFGASGQLTSDDNNKLQALGVILGFDSQKIRDVYLSQLRRQTHKEYYQEVAKKAQQYANIAQQGGEKGAVAGVLYRLTTDDDSLSAIERMQMHTETAKRSISQGHIPLYFREWMESAKTKIKTGESTLY